MEFGWYHEFHRQVPGQSDADAFEQGFQQAEDAERWGLDVFWLAEIHQQARRSVLSAPLNVAGQLAARTKRIKIGTAVHVLPLNHPLRLAEETATIDQISRGRCMLGAGRSGNPRGYAAYGVPYSESRERFYETLEIVKKAWTEETFSLRRQVSQLRQCARGAAALPAAASADPHRRRQRGHLPDARPARLSAVRVGAQRLAARGWRRTSRPIATPTARPAIPATAKSICACRCMSATPTGRRSTKASRASWPATNRCSTRLEGSPNARRRAEAEEVRTATYADVLRDKVIVGGPERVTDRLKELEEVLGIDGILFELNFGAAIPAELMMNSLRLICEKVMPHFK